MENNRATTILLVIAAAIGAWFIVDGLLSAVWFLIRLALVAVVAAIVYFLLSSTFRGKSRRDD